MRRILFASLVALAPSCAFAQDAATPPTPPPDTGWAPPAWQGHSALSPDQRDMMAFYKANTTHDGHLTLAQAKASNFKLVVDHFDEIDTSKRGYITFYDIQAWRLDQIANRLEKQAKTLRAMDK